MISSDVRTPQESIVLERGLTEEEIKIVEGIATYDEPAPAGPAVSAAPFGEPTRARRTKSAYAKAPDRPAQAGISPEQAYADAAHFYGKEEPPSYETTSSEQGSGGQT